MKSSALFYTSKFKEWNAVSCSEYLFLAEKLLKDEEVKILECLPADEK